MKDKFPGRIMAHYCRDSDEAIPRTLRGWNRHPARLAKFGQWLQRFSMAPQPRGVIHHEEHVPLETVSPLNKHVWETLFEVFY